MKERERECVGEGDGATPSEAERGPEGVSQAEGQEEATKEEGSEEVTVSLASGLVV